MVNNNKIKKLPESLSELSDLKAFGIGMSQFSTIYITDGNPVLDGVKLENPESCTLEDLKTSNLLK